MKLYFFTASFPYGVGEQWKMRELHELMHYFDEITIIPYNYHGNFDQPKRLPQGVKVTAPLFKTDSFSVTRGKAYKLLFQKHSLIFLKEFFNKKVYKKRKKVSKWMLASFNVIRLLGHPTIKDMLEKSDKETVLYFYWGKGSAEIVPFIDTSKFRKTVVRMHRFDLYEYINDGYIPYRSRLMEKTFAIAAPCSDSGKAHLLDLYPKAFNQPVILRIGTEDNGKQSSPSTDNVLRIVSCSMLSPVKRVRLMIESLQFIDFPVVWSHIGDGELRLELENLARQLNVQDRFVFEGLISSDQVLDFYTDNSFDLFINVSASEGVPVSIMEAFAAGLPVLATDVGGTSEIVDECVGKLLPEKLDSRTLACEIKSYYYLSENERLKKRQNAYKRYQDKCNGKKLAKKVVEFLAH